jgi:hypothetical protein
VEVFDHTTKFSCFNSSIYTPFVFKEACLIALEYSTNTSIMLHELNYYDVLRCDRLKTVVLLRGNNNGFLDVMY